MSQRSSLFTLSAIAALLGGGLPIESFEKTEESPLRRLLRTGGVPRVLLPSDQDRIDAAQAKQARKAAKRLELAARHADAARRYK